MTTLRKSICFIAATPLTIHFFFRPHLQELSKEFDVTLVVNLKNDSYLPNLDLPIKVINAPIERKISPIQDLLAIATLFKIFKQKRFDLVITVVPKAGLLGMIAAFMAFIPKRLHIFQGEVWANRAGFERLLLKTCDRITSSLATNILAVSNSEKVFLVNQGVVENEKIQVLGKGSIGGVNLVRFASNKSAKKILREKLSIPKDALVIIFMGRLVADKGVFLLAESFSNALETNPNLWLLMVGPDEGQELSQVLEILGSASERFSYFPYTSTPEEWFALSDILCLPSYREGFGVVIIEAGAMEIPSIGSRIYGISDAIIENQTGLLFDCGNADQLQKCIEKLSNDSALRLELGNNALKIVNEDFSDQHVVGKYVQYLRKLLN